MVYIKKWGAAYIKREWGAAIYIKEEWDQFISRVEREWEQYISRRRGDNTYQEGVGSIIYQGGEGGAFNIKQWGAVYIKEEWGAFNIKQWGAVYIKEWVAIYIKRE